MKNNRKSAGLRTAPPPCSASCDKCGGTDIYRRHRRAAEQFSKLMGDYTTWENAHVRYDTYYAFAKRECIVHHCRTCGYEWATDIHKPNAHALAEERSDDSQQRVVGATIQKEE